jgi:lysophospholipase L1-like esterase
MTRLVLFALFTAAAFAQPATHIRPHDRIVFYGDSITDQRLYTTFAETFLVTRFPKWQLSFTHSGWGGDRVSGGAGGPVDVRLWRDVLPYNPTVVTIMLGMNDARYRAFDPAIFDEYEKGYRAIVATLKRRLPGARLTVIQPSPFDDVTRAPQFEGGYNSVLRRYGEFLAQLASAEKLHVADLNTSVVEALKKANAMNATDAAKMIPDRVHPGASGHLLMAKALLESWNVPALVCEVEIDAARAAVVQQRHAQITALAGAGKTLAWTQLDEALPMPVDSKDSLVSLAVKASNFHDALNRQILKVTKLAPGNYTLKIDGAPVGAFSAAQLAQGLNLAELATPMQDQAAQVHALTLQHASIHNTRWRQVQVPQEKSNTPELLAALSALDQLETTLIKEQRALALPLPHRFELVPE